MKVLFKQSLCTAMLFIITLGVYAQSGKIIGVIKDNGNKEPLGFVTVNLKKSTESKKIYASTATNENGKFSIEGLKDGVYNMVITYVGYDSIARKITISPEKQNINLGTLMMKENSVMLQGVTVTGMKSQMKFDIDKKVFNVDQNLAASGGSASEVLENIPSVDVDNDGAVSLRGNSSVTVWINGKASGLNADNQASILEQLPAEDIDKIEIITNPSAKYSPEGTAGIINIVMKKNRKAGYYGSVQAGGNTTGGANANANISVSGGKWDMNASFGYRHRNSKNGSVTNRENLSASGNTFLNTQQNGKNVGNGYNYSLGASYRLTDVDEFSVNTSGMFNNGSRKTDINYLTDVPNSFTNRWRNNNTDNDMMGINALVGYKHNFTKESTLDLSASFNLWNMNNGNKYNQNTEYTNRTETSYQNQDSKIRSKHWEAQADYVLPFSKNNKLEAGYKGTFNYEHSPVSTISGISPETAVEDKNLYNDYKYNQNIQAVYATYSGRIGKFGYQGGLRGEYTHINTRSLMWGQTENDVTPYKNNRFDLFPSVFLTYSLPKDNELQVNYSRRIQRPWGGQLNSFKNISDSTNISFGNPELKPAFSNSLELNYIKNFEQHVLSASLYFRSTNDVVQQIRYLNNNVMLTTNENVAHTTSSGLELVSKNRLWRILDLTTTVNLYYNTLDGFSFTPPQALSPVVGESQNSFAWDARIIANVQLPLQFSINANGRYNSSQLIAQGKNEESYVLDLGARKILGNWAFALSVRDVLDSRHRKSTTSGEGFTQYYEGWRNGRRFGLTVTYNFGNMKAKRKENKKNQSADVSNGYDTDMGD